MKNKVASLLTSLCLLLATAAPAFAGGALETFDITANAPSPIAGHIAARMVGIRWDTRSIPVRYSMNTSFGANVPNPLGAPVLTLAQAQAAFQASFDEWNNLPTSFIDMRITGTTGNSGLRGFDMVNELTFRTANNFTAIASSPSTSLISDSTFVAGDDIDGDGDSDVSAAITTAQDADADGDIEFPPGFYKAGTILDNDVQFNTKVSNGFRFTVGDAALDTVGRSVDINTVATHEFGHSFGLSHSMDNQISASHGGGATMFPFIDTTDPASELDQRSPSEDDVAWSSYFYQEGSAASGPAALQPGDVAFKSRYGLITGELRHGVQGLPLAGGSAAAYKWDTGELVASGYSGTTQLSFNPATGQLFFVSPAFNIIDGKYTIPVPKGSYAVGVEPVDGNPVPVTSVSFTTQIGNFFGQQNFNEEFYNNNSEGVGELRTGQRKNVTVQPGKATAGINVVTGRAANINNFDTRNSIGFTGSPAGRLYAVQIPPSQIAAANTALNPGGDILIQAAAFDTAVLNSSVPALFARAALASGTVSGPNATIDLANPLADSLGFLGQEGDFAPFYFQEPHDLGRRVKAGIADGSIQNLFMVLQIPTTTPFPGVSGTPPLIGLDTVAPFRGLSFISNDGGVTWTRVTTFDFRFSLILSGPVAP